MPAADSQGPDGVPDQAEAARATHQPRLQQVDALRGLAALSVVLFHYTTRFEQLFHPDPGLQWGFAHGHYGVNLFFIISGFVIFMTLHRTRRPMDFVVSRFSRLFPTYWFAIVLTFTITHLLGLPGKLVSLASAVGNLAMVHNLFRVPHVDGVYWTLEVELLFYIGMFALYRFGQLRRIHLALGALLALRLSYQALDSFFGIELSWTVSRLLILNYIPWFSLGICIYLLLNGPTAAQRQRNWLVISMALFTLGVAGSVLEALLAVAFATAVYFAAAGRLAVLRHPVLVWLGAISYPLYLLHENIGWSIQLQALRLGVPIAATVVLALAVALGLSAAVTQYVEQPCMKWIRQRYRSRLP